MTCRQRRVVGRVVSLPRCSAPWARATAAWRGYEARRHAIPAVDRVLWTDRGETPPPPWPSKHSRACEDARRLVETRWNAPVGRRSRSSVAPRRRTPPAMKRNQPLLRRLHWLRMPERVSFRLAVLVYRCLHGSAPGYLASDLHRVSHLNARRRLRSSTTSALVVPRTVRSTIGDRTFPATAASVWNSLPESVRSSPSLQVFRSKLKTELFAWSYSHD